MKKDIQPQVYTDCKVSCACGTTFTTISTQKGISVEICSKCHPFFTGQQRFVDTEGRIDTFEKKAKLMAEKKEKALAIKEAKTKRTSSKTTEKKPTLKDILSKEEN